MAVLPIRISGDPVLHFPALPVERFDDELKQLVHDMFDTMDMAPGVGLAAPQVGVALRLFVYDFPTEDEVQRRGVVINPELWITPTPLPPADELEESEGCLSFPGERFPLRRAESAILHAVDLDNEPLEIRADGWFARILQHETDHLNGVLYTDRLEPVHAKAATKILKKSGWGVPELSWLPGMDDLEG